MATTNQYQIPFDSNTTDYSFEQWLIKYNALADLSVTTDSNITYIQSTITEIYAANPAALRTNVDDLTTKYASLSTSIGTANTNISTNEDNITALQNTSYNTNINIASLQSILSDVVTRITAIQSSQTNESSQIAQLQNTANILTSKVLTLESSSTATVQTYIDQLQQEDAAIQASITEINANITEANTSILSLTSSLTSNSTKVQNALDNDVSIESRLAVIQAKTDDIPLNGYTILTAENTSLSSRITTLESDKNTIDASILSLSGTESNINTSLINLTNQYNTLHTAVTDLDNLANNPLVAINAINTEIGLLNTQIDGINTTLTSNNTSIVNINNSITTINGNITTINNDITAANSDISTLTGDVGVQTTNINNAALDINALIVRAGSLESALNSSRLIVSLLPATAITNTSMTLNGTLDSLGGNPNVNCYFMYRQLGQDFIYTPVQNKSVTGSFIQSISGLSNGLFYEVYAVVEGTVAPIAKYASLPKIENTPLILDVDSGITFTGGVSGSYILPLNMTSFTSAENINANANIIQSEVDFTLELVNIAQAPITDPEFKRVNAVIALRNKGFSVAATNSTTTELKSLIPNLIASSDYLATDDNIGLKLNPVTISATTNQVNHELNEFYNYNAAGLSKNQNVYVLTPAISSNEILVSLNGKSWRRTKTESNFSSSAAATFSDTSIFVTSLSNNKLFKSDDNGVSFKTITLPVSINCSAKLCYGVHSNPVIDKVYVLTDNTASSNTVLFSLNGESFGQIALPDTYQGSLECSFANDTFVIVDGTSNTNKVFYSFDGTNWIKATLPSSVTANAPAYYDGTTWKIYDALSANMFTSLDAITWTQVSSDIAVPVGMVVSLVNDIYVAYSLSVASNIIQVSRDGLTWQNEDIKSAILIKSIAFQDGEYLILGKTAILENIIIKSAVLLNTESHRINENNLGSSLLTKLTNGNLVSVDYGSNTLAYTADLVTWSKVTILANRLIASLQEVNGVYFIGSGTTIAKSLDFVSWNNITPGTGLFKDNIIYAFGSYYVLDSSENTAKLYKSSDLIVWTLVTLSDVVSGGKLYTDGTSILITDANSSRNYIFNSVDGVSFTKIALSANYTTSRIQKLNGKFIIVDETQDANIIQTSSDALTWTPISIPATISAKFKYIEFANGKYLLTNQTLSNKVYVSADAINWNEIVCSTYSTSVQPLYFNNLWYIFNNHTNDQFILGNSTATSFGTYSTESFAAQGTPINFVTSMIFKSDQLNDSVLTVTSTASSLVKKYNYNVSNISDIESFDNKTVISITGSSNKILYTDDGIVWNKITLPVSISSGLLSVNENGNFICTDSTNGSTIVLYSKDGLIWEAKTLPATYTGSVKPIKYNGMFLLVDGSIGTNKVFTSPDGKIWTQQSTGTFGTFTKIYYLNNMFLLFNYASSVNQYYTSTDGASWIARTLPINMTNVIGATSGNEIVLIDANLNSNVLLSSDGIAWTIQTTGINFTAVDFAYYNGSYVFGDYSGSSKVYKSVNGITWTYSNLVSTFRTTKLISTINGLYFVSNLNANGDYYASLDLVTFANIIGDGIVKNSAYSKNGLIIFNKVSNYAISQNNDNGLQTKINQYSYIGTFLNSISKCIFIHKIDAVTKCSISTSLVPNYINTAISTLLRSSNSTVTYNLTSVNAIGNNVKLVTQLKLSSLISLIKLDLYY